MPKTAIRIGPKDHGRHMSLEDFDLAEGQEGYLYELSRGIITVMDVPDSPHLAQVTAIRRQLSAYDLAHPKRLYTIAAGSECKLLLADLESERHPDLAIYKTLPPRGKHFWTRWIPEIVIEVISRGSEYRDYEEKREEYFRFGVREYWIFNAARQEMLVLRRSAAGWTERVLRPPKLYRTRVLPGLAFDCAPVFAAARAVQE
jgi:Uma2 family endonuclease